MRHPVHPHLKPESIRADGLFRSYGPLAVLSDCSLAVSPGEICCLMGPSGSGKTTLLRILSGLEPPDQGRLFVPSHLSAVFQEDRLIEHLSPVENIRLVLPRRIAPNLKETARQLEEILPSQSLFRPVSTLSGGMKRRCAVARAILAPSQAVLMDEPFSGLDQATKEQVIGFIRQRLDGRPLLLSTHSPEDAKLLNARIIRLNPPSPTFFPSVSQEG